MATAETRRKEEPRSRDGGVQSGSQSQKEGRSKRSTRQLDFFQAMSDFKSMFPTLDDEVIEAVLRANDGAVDATIDQLLTMTIDEDMSSVKMMEGASFNSPQMAQYIDGEATGRETGTEDSPPSYSEAMRTPGPTDQAHSIWTTPIGPPKIQSRNQLKLEVDSHPEPLGAMARLSPTGLQSNLSTPGLGFSTSSNTHDGFSVQRSSVTDLNSTCRKREYRNWNPPMLGTLPDDFLRLMLPDTKLGTPSAKSDTDKTSNLSTTPVNVLSLSDTRPKIHKNRSKSDKLSHHSSLTGSDMKDSKSRSSEKKSKSSSDKVQRSFSLMEGKSSGARHKDKHSSGHSPSRSKNHGVIIETHDFSKGMLEERIKENERRRKKTSAEYDPELAQYLEDERLALALQNSEFLQELRSNDDFMKILRKEHLNSKTDLTSSTTTTQPVQTTTTTPQRPTDDLYEGYGDDSDKTLEAFPFSQPTTTTTSNGGKDDDAELRRQLSGMGKASKKQLASLARKFFKRKKKNSKQILGEKLAPSMMNLLEDEDEEDDDLNIDSRYGNSPPEIEPLPSSLIGVPSSRGSGHRSSHRQHDNVNTYFDNSQVDIV
ncbi:CUE domain containing [Mactra antiquata]